jgi:hypothetical protein
VQFLVEALIAVAPTPEAGLRFRVGVSIAVSDIGTRSGSDGCTEERPIRTAAGKVDVNAGKT